MFILITWQKINIYFTYKIFNNYYKITTKQTYLKSHIIISKYYNNCLNISNQTNYFNIITSVWGPKEIQNN